MDARHAAAALETLRDAGASGAALDSLLAYTANPFDLERLRSLELPLPDEPHLRDWDAYATEAGSCGVIPALSRVLVQLRFPIEAGISQREDYRAATRRGVMPAGAAGVSLVDAAAISLDLHPTLAGRIPLLTCPDRADFVTLVRALSCRNEPDAVPRSMGACIVTGLNNWDRVRRARARLEAERGAPFDEPGWSEAFRALIPQKPLYQDRLILLSREPYSGVPAAVLSLDDDAWRTRSVIIRREHECTHYFTLRALGGMRNNLLDEIIADFAGLTASFGRYDAGLALRCLGLEDYPAYREGGRFQNYLQEPPVAPEAVPILRGIVVRAARSLEQVTAGTDLGDAGVRARVVVALAGTTLVELASASGAALFGARLQAVPGLARTAPGGA